MTDPDLVFDSEIELHAHADYTNQIEILRR